jgi:hypothetical protein
MALVVCTSVDILIQRPERGLVNADMRTLFHWGTMQAIPTAVADVRGSDGTSPPEAVDFILTILKHNDNSGNAYSDVFWLASVIESVSSLEFGQQVCCLCIFTM